MFNRGFLKFMKDTDQLSRWCENYNNAKPFPHIVIDDAFEDRSLAAVVQNFPDPDPTWWSYQNPLERKFAKDDLSDEHFVIQSFIANLQSRRFTDFLEKLTGIKGLIVDQTLRGGGLHAHARGGCLGIHADHNYHAVTGLDRRLNVLVYLNSGWRAAWKGDLELWDSKDGDLTECRTKIMPIRGRMVIFNTTDTAFHGLPEPLECPDKVLRRSIALYYWTNGRPEAERSEPHSTIYKRRPSDPADTELDKLREERAKGRIKA